ncbi:APC family permease [Agrococcus sp. SGAir0287]|uniref:APC family permease n=1 Tax=Agrococcus sp. SGAir0287 TaxID=2070347 RepID=UPI0020C74A6C|nr:APC family permease [Agrococcus sp. SGAir0287]
MTSDERSPKRWIIGKPLPTEQLEGELLPKKVALPIFASDALSSVAYGPQEMFLILTIGGLALLSNAPYVAIAVMLLIAIVVAGNLQIVKAYPSGGGDYEVAHRNLGPRAGLVVASALLIDYVLTVAVSVASGVDNIISAFPQLDPYRVEIAVGFIVLLAAANLRGVRESGRAFAVPTYLFIASVVVLIVVGLVQTLTGNAPVAESAQYTVQTDSLSQAAIMLLLLRSFASGCSALTGIEAISNGVPAFRRPKVRNARITLVLLGVVSMSLFAGITILGLISRIHYAEDPCDLVGFASCETTPQPSVIGQLGAAVFGDGSPLFYVLLAATALVLLLAANTAFNGFPLLGSVLANHGYAPKALRTRGDRLVYSNGVIVLALGATLLIVAFQANLNQLIQMYIIGVFVSFTFGQSGMVVHWNRIRRDPKRRGEFDPVSYAVNVVGAIATSMVLVVVTITKFTHGAYLVFLIGPVLWVLMWAIHRYYARVRSEIEPDEHTVFGARGDHAIVLVGELTKPVLKALDYAIAARHESLEAVHSAIDPEAAKRLKKAWIRQSIHVPLRILPSPYRDVSQPVIDHIEERRVEHGPEIVTVYMPKYVVGHWWERVLHGHKSRRVRQRLSLTHGVAVALVPWRLQSARLLEEREARPLPGDARRGTARRPRPVTRQHHSGHRR